MMFKRFLWIGLLAAVLLTACDPDSPSVLDDQVQIAEQQTDIALSATVPTDIPPSQTPLPSRTPTMVVPTVALPTPTPDVDRSPYVTQSFLPGPWKTAFFTVPSEERFVLNDLQPNLVIVQTLSTVCGVCQEQTDALRLAGQRLIDLDSTEGIIFLTLSVDGLDTLELVADYQTQFGLPNSEDLDWRSGLASRALLQDLRDTFGESYIDPSTSRILYIDQSGFGHIPNPEVFLGEDELVEAVFHFLTGASFGQDIEADERQFFPDPNETPDPTETPFATEEVTEEPSE